MTVAYTAKDPPRAKTKGFRAVVVDSHPDPLLVIVKPFDLEMFKVVPRKLVTQEWDRVVRPWARGGQLIDPE